MNSHIPMSAQQHKTASANRPTARELHISSFIVTVPTQNFEQTFQELERVSGLEIPLFDKAQGKIIIVVEAHSLRAIEQQVQNIQALPHVHSVALVYHHAEDPQSLEEKNL